MADERQGKSPIFFGSLTSKKVCEMDFSELFGYTHSESSQYLEREVQRVLSELKEEIGELKLAKGSSMRPFSTVPIPHDIEYYRKEKELMIQRTLKVSQARPLVKQIDLQREEMENAEKPEYTTKNIPLLLHQHFTDRIYQLIQCKHQHLLRWKRFSTNTTNIEALYPEYSKRVRKIIKEYEDCVSRAERLSIARVSSSKSQTDVLMQIRIEDMLIYLRWLSSHLNSMKKFNQFLKILQWLPVTHNHKFSCPQFSDEKLDRSAKPVNRLSVRYEEIKMGQRPVSSSTGSFSHILSNIPSMIKDKQVQQMSTQALPTSVMSWALGFLGGGRCSNDLTLEIPIHSLKFQDFKNQLKFLANIYGIKCDIESIKNLNDEMTLYSETYKIFLTVFAEQEAAKNFVAYDTGEPNSKRDRMLKKPANWIPFIKLKPERNVFQENEWAMLHQEQQIDLLLQQQANFLKINDPEKIMAVLQNHASILSEENSLEAINLMNEKCLQKTETLWKKIYSSSNVYSMTTDKNGANFNDDDTDSFGEEPSKLQQFQSETYNYTTTIKMLGLETVNQNEMDPAMQHAAYLSLLFLRHLRIRELQYSCLLSLNYLRSIERTLTINDSGLSLNGEQLIQTSPQNHRNLTELSGTLGGGGGLDTHGYLHNTPADFRIRETDFIESSDVENHDDYYEIKDENIYVQDEKGFYIMYDEAINDLNTLEEDLLLLGSHYINKDKSLRDTFLNNRRKFLLSEEINNNFLNPEYVFMHVDRFGILLDAWTQEVAFQNCKRNLIRCYFEAYCNVFDRDERRLLAQTITQIIHQRPRFHSEYTQYFNNTYFNECISLHLHTSLVTTILNQQIEDQRNYIARIKEGMYGLPWPIINHYPISIHTNKSALTPLFLLEFHPSLALASRIPKAINYAVQELAFLYCVNESENIFVIERKVFEIALKEWKSMKVPGLSFSEEVQRDLFSNSFVEDAALMSHMATNIVSQPELGARKNFKEKQLRMIKKVQSVFELVSLRHRLIEAAWETEILSELYKKQAQELNFGEHHLHLRSVPFEFASYQNIKKMESTFMTTVVEDDSNLDRYIPRNLQLAIHEYDIHQVGQFSFKSRGLIEQLLTPEGLLKLQLVLKCQICQRNALMACVQQVHYSHCKVIQAENRPHYKDKTTRKIESRITRFKMKSRIFESHQIPKKELIEEEVSGIVYPETFISLQMEKHPIRDLMLNNYLIHLRESGSMNDEEAETYKRTAISGFCDKFFGHMSQYSLRNQIIAYYKSLNKILDHFPLIRSTYFLMGTYKKATAAHALDSEISEMNSMNQVLSSDGKEVCNIWYLPHSIEIVHLFKNLDEKRCIESLTNMLRICSALHDLVHYIFAHIEMGNKHVPLFTGQSTSESSADSGGVEGIKTEFREIQAQIQSLSKPTCPVLVGELLTIRRDITFLEFDLSVRHCIIETFLMSGNRAAYEALSINMDISLTSLSDAKRDTLFNMYLKVPEPLEASDAESKKLYPWRSFMGCHGPFPCMFWQFFLIDYYIHLCTSSLKDVDRTIASGEILGVSLTIEDMLLSEFPPMKAIRNDSLELTPMDTTSISDIAKRVLAKKTEKQKKLHPHLTTEFSSEDLADDDSVDKKVDPIDIYTLLQFCLIVWKQLEIVKQVWMSLWQHLFCGNPIEDYQESCKIYRQEIMFPVLQSLAKKYGQTDLYVGIAQISDPLIIPSGTSELEVKICQLKRLLENLDHQMTRQVLKKVQQNLSLAVAERSREEMILPTDLWRSSNLNEQIQLTYPNEMMEFREKLFSEVLKSATISSEATFTFTEDHLNDCLQSLAQSMIRREKYTYESYISYFEKLIKTYHDQLYHKEQEIKQFQEEQHVVQESIASAVECQMADKTFHLLIEITYLRHKVEELKEKNKQKNAEVHNEVREDYSKLIENFFIASSELREKFDVFRHELKDDVMDKITIIRREVIEEMDKVRMKYNLPDGENCLQVNLSRAEEVRQLQADNNQLNILLLKLRTINTWRQNFSQANYLKAINKLMKDVNKLKRENIKLNLLSNKENQLLKQQVTALRHELANTVKEFSSLRTQLDAELRLKEEKLHRNKQDLEYELQKDQIKQEHMDRLLEELSQKERKVKMSCKSQEQRRMTLAENQSRGAVSSLKKFLEQERNLKLKAFQEVDRLRTLVDELETPMVSQSRPKSAIPARSSTSFGAYRSRHSSGRSTALPSHSFSSTSNGSTRTGWAKKRSLTVDPKDARTIERRKMIQRPKTATGQMQSFFSSQLTTQEDLYQLSDIIDSGDK